MNSMGLKTYNHGAYAEASDIIEAFKAIDKVEGVKGK